MLKIRFHIMHLSRKYLLILTIVSMCELSWAATKNILLIAGEPSHAPGEHEFVEGVKLLTQCLNESDADLKADWTLGFSDRKKLAAADAIFIYSDGLEKHVAAGEIGTIEAHIDRGGGLGVVHWALEPYDEEMAAFMNRTLGGHFAVNHSVNPIWTLNDPILADHPIARGVTLDEIRDEWYYNIRFAEEITPVLQAKPPPDSLGGDGPRSGNPSVRAALSRGIPQTLAWTRELDNGARMFGFTGGHYHYNWNDDGYRKLILNAIVWCAQTRLPAHGIASEITPIPRHDSIDRAIAMGDIADVERHIAANPTSIHQGRNERLTPLQQAILRKKSEIAILLIDRGASVDKADGSERTPLHLATERDLPEVIAALLEKNANPDLLDRTGWTPLHHAAAKNRIEVLQALLDGGANPMLLSERGGTPLHEAAASGSAELARALIDAGTDPSVVSETGVTAMDIAAEFNNSDVVELLRALDQQK